VVGVGPESAGEHSSFKWRSDRFVGPIDLFRGGNRSVVGLLDWWELTPIDDFCRGRDAPRRPPRKRKGHLCHLSQRGRGAKSAWGGKGPRPAATEGPLRPDEAGDSQICSAVSRRVTPRQPPGGGFADSARPGAARRILKGPRKIAFEVKQAKFLELVGDGGLEGKFSGAPGEEGRDSPVFQVGSAGGRRRMIGEGWGGRCGKTAVSVVLGEFVVVESWC